MADRSRSGNTVRGATGWAIGLVLCAFMATAAAPRADAMCCLCRNCPGAAFCVDTVNNSLACAQLCVGVSCNGTVFDSVDTCEGGCNGAPVAPTATTSATRTVTATATATPTSSPSATPTATPGLSGRIGYYVGDRPVEDVTVGLFVGTSASATTLTDADGEFGFTSVMPGMQRLQPNKDGDFNVAITVLDATLILQFVDGSEDFSDDQLIAGDATGDGTISTLDATRILQFQAGTRLRLPVAEKCASDWGFRPSPLLIPNQTLIQPDTAALECRMGAIQYNDMFTPPAAGQDFVAILFGDVTGNWMPAPPP